VHVAGLRGLSAKTKRRFLGTKDERVTGDRRVGVFATRVGDESGFGAIKCC
jgi:hypothetical protein